ncbi:MAG: hypothetical protein ACPGNW_04655, partial [Verrucomicrobiales bacterium]
MFSSFLVSAFEKKILLQQGHAHNDYYHERPLEDALECFFCSVEVDVFLRDGKFLVGHDKSELKKEKTIEKLYLDPLKKRVLQGGGYVYEEKVSFTLFIDIKSEGKSAYGELSKLLKNYDDVQRKLEIILEKRKLFLRRDQAKYFSDFHLYHL